uniref:Uncharacterized protein n=1 Tax=Anguilla anguilla TaxID=7936 RepID=A0A0E9PTC7_ANGAN
MLTHPTKFLHPTTHPVIMHASRHTPPLSTLQIELKVQHKLNLKDTERSYHS